jgi:hypothetical protein
VEQDLRPPGSPAPGRGDTSAPSDSTVKFYRLVWLLLGFVIALTLVVLVILPSMVAERQHTGDELPADSAIIVPPPLAVGVARHDAEQGLQEFLRLRADPELVNAETWAADRWQRAMDAAAEGDQLYGRGRFGDALGAYNTAAESLKGLLQDKQKIYRELLDQGWALLQQQNAAEAYSAFQRAMAVHDSEEVQRGLARSRVRDRVLSLLELARQAEDSGDLGAAAAAYSEALTLDADYEPLRVGKQKIDAELDRRQFEEAISRFLASLERGQFAAAESSLRTAAAVYADHPAVQDARSRLRDARRTARLGQLQKKAARSEQAEDWKAAAVSYRDALAVDQQAVFALSGLQQAESRIRLHQQLDHYLADSLRLSSPEPLANARHLLEMNQSTPPGEPVLAAKLATLAEAVRLAVLPVWLDLQSDGMTDVTIYHVGQLGQFQHKRLSLRPGKYTVIGARPGFRDVRKVVILKPGIDTVSVAIRCEEPI